MYRRGYPPAVVANNFLERAARRGGLTPMQVIKLVYLAHAFHLGYGRGPLINEPVEAWKYGPVVRSLYNQVRDYEGLPIAELLRTGDYDWERESRVDFDADHVIGRVWENYGHYNGYELSDMTHLPGSPWWITWNDRGGWSQFSSVIEDDLIRECYESKLGLRERQEKSRYQS